MAGSTGRVEPSAQLYRVSSAPSKIPYGGFSPVRLQTNFQTSDLHDDGAGLSAVHIRPPAVTYTLAQCPNPTHASDSKAVRCRGAGAQNRPRILRFNRTRRLPTSTRSSRGPWLASRLCCPAGSSLTMASSEPLAWQQSDLCFSHKRRPRKRPRAASQRFPNLLRKALRPCHLPYPGGLVSAYGCCFLTNSGLRLGVRGSASAMGIFEAAEFA